MDRHGSSSRTADAQRVDARRIAGDHSADDDKSTPHHAATAPTEQGYRELPGNINISFNFVEGESLIMALKDLAVSSGSACTSASLEPSYVLRALGRNDELAHSSIRFSIGRFTTEQDIDRAIQLVRDNIDRLRELSPLWDMYKDGVDLDKVEWVAH